MAIAPPNYTQIPNIFLDEMGKNLSEAELRVILVLMRQTFGWHKEWDRISLNQLAEKTGMTRKSICRALESLLRKGHIQKKKFGTCGREKCYYALVMEEQAIEAPDANNGYESEEEMELISNNSDQCPKDTPPVSLGHPPSVLKTHTKETLSKETTQKKQQHSEKTAVVSSENALHEKTAEKKKSASSCYECLDIDIPFYDKVEITNSYPEETVKYAVLWALHPLTEIKTTLAQAIKWACKVKPEMPKDEIQQKEDNRSYALKYQGLESGNVKIEVLGRLVLFEWCIPCMAECFSLEFEENGFKEKFIERLKKHRFTIQE